MKAEHINSFYAATQDVFKTLFDLKVNRGDIKVVEGLVTSKNANVSLGVTGDLKGSVLFSFTNDMALEMVKIMSGMEMEKIDKFVSSALGEVANIIGGNSLTNLSKNDYTCNIAPPQVIIGKYESLSLANKKAILIPINTDIGEFNINIFLSEN